MGLGSDICYCRTENNVYNEIRASLTKRIRIEVNQFLRNQDMVKVGCHDCQGCHDCCTGMGDSVWLDPYDFYLLKKNLGLSFEALLQQKADLHVEDGLIFVHLRMEANRQNRCVFLNEEGRCEIHQFRPGFCRLFPLGRNYEGNQLTYFLLENACPMKNKTKMKVSKWLDVPKLNQYEHYLLTWHQLTKSLRAVLMQNLFSEEQVRMLNMDFLNTFYREELSGEQDQIYALLEEKIKQFQAKWQGKDTEDKICQ